MKIAIITTGGRDLHRRWAQSGLQLGSAVNALLQGFSHLVEHEVHVLMAMRQNAKSSWTEGNTTFHEVPTPGWGMMKSLYLGAATSIRRRLREIQPDVVHGHGTERECSIAAVLSGFPNFITIHGNMRLIARVNRVRPLSYTWIAARLESFAVPLADGIICISRHTQAIVQESARRTWIIPNGVEEEFFSIQRDVSSARTIVCIGNILRLKNQNGLIRALDPIAQELQLDLLFLGSAAPGDSYVREFEELLATRSWCRHIGYVNRETVRKWLGESRCLILPSLEENCPMVVLEAMAVGLPVVAARIGGVPDLVEHGMTGLLFDPADPQSMRDAVSKAVQKSSDLEVMAQTAQQRARTTYSPAQVAAKHIVAYSELLS